MIDINKIREDALNKFEEDRESYNLSTYDNYIAKLREFEEAKEAAYENEYSKMYDDLNSKIDAMKTKINNEKQSQSALEDQLKFEQAEKKGLSIISLEKELSTFKRRLEIVERKMNDAAASVIQEKGRALYNALLAYHDELNSLIDNNLKEIQERERKLAEDKQKLRVKNSSISYKVSDLETAINKLLEYK